MKPIRIRWWNVLFGLATMALALSGFWLRFCHAQLTLDDSARAALRRTNPSPAVSLAPRWNAPNTTSATIRPMS